MQTALLEPKSTETDNFPSGRRIRLCHVSLTLCTGGLERLLVDFARFHNVDQIDVEFLALGETGQPAADIEAIGRPVHRIDSSLLSKFTLVRELAAFFRSGKYDVVHTHNAFPHLYATIGARMAGIPTVVHTRHGRRFGQTWKERFHYSIGGKLCDRVVAVSDDTAALCKERGSFDHRKVTRIWNGVDLSRFNHRRVNHNDPVAITVARLSPEKDIATMLRATAIVVKHQPMFRLIIVGDGPERANLHGLANRLGISESVDFLGERNDVPELLSKAAFFVCSSRTEGVSLTLLEAMATELPVVATDVGGNPEVVIDGETGLLVPANDPETLAESMFSLLETPASWDPFGFAGRERVQEHFCIRSMVSQYEELYSELLAHNMHTVSVSNR